MSSSSSSDCIGCETGLDDPRCHKNNCYLNRSLNMSRGRKKSRSPSRSRKKSRSPSRTRKKSRSPKRKSSTPKRRGKWDGESRSRSLSSMETLDGSDIVCIGCETGADAPGAHCARCNENIGFGARRTRRARRRTHRARRRTHRARRRTHRARRRTHRAR